MSTLVHKKWHASLWKRYCCRQQLRNTVGQENHDPAAGSAGQRSDARERLKRAAWVMSPVGSIRVGVFIIS